jgi:hypothetical protein
LSLGGTHDLDDRPSSADNPNTVQRSSIGMLSADVCQASVCSPPTSTDAGPMFQPMGRRSADQHPMLVDCRWIVGGLSVDCRWIVGGLSVDCRWSVGGVSVERQQGIGRQFPDL